MKIFQIFLVLLLFTLIPVLNLTGQNISCGIKNTAAANPKITEVISEINKDSIYQTILQLCSFGTRSVYADNRRAVAEWTVGKFQSFGYVNVAIDSFKIINKYPPIDSIWQYNVSADLPGSSSANEVYLFGCHPDAANQTSDQRILAPGADDDASGMAGMLEIARVLKKVNFQPFATIRFTTLSSEEVLLFGAKHYVNKALQNKENIRVMFSMDMIAYTNSGTFPVSVYQVKHQRTFWTGDLIMQCIQSYVNLLPEIGDIFAGNERPFIDNGFNIGTIFEKDYNGRIHTDNDSIQYLNMDMCREVTRAYCAAVLNEHYVPVPYNLTTHSDKDRIKVLWSGRKNATMAGFNIYRSIYDDSTFIKINPSIVSDTVFEDLTASLGTNYFYKITSVNKDNFESTTSNSVSGYRMSLDRELLVIKDAKGNTGDPADSLVIDYYKRIFRDFTYDFIDASTDTNFNPGILGHYKRVAWLSSNLYQNKLNSAFLKNQNEVFTYLKNQGNLLLSCPQPSALLASNSEYNKIFSQLDEIYGLFKIKEAHRMFNALFCGAYPVVTGYDSIYVDPLKSLSNNPLHIKNIETLVPAQAGAVIYRFDSKFDTSTSLGMMKGKPVGIEYLGQDYKVVVLSLPLYFMDSIQAKNLVEFIITKKFPTQTGVDDRLFDPNDIFLFQNYPNPVINHATFPYYLPHKADVSFEVITLLGKKVIMLKQEKVMGNSSFTININGLPDGIYFGVLRSENRQRTIRFLVNKN
jgi:hypothetical protein